MKKFFAKVLTLLPTFIAQYITLDSHNRIGHWYHTNGIYKFPVGSMLALKNPYSFGYGVRPVGIVKGYTDDGEYLVEMESDVDGNFMDWMNGKYVPIPKGHRSSQRETHFKWNIEYHFEKVPRTDPEWVYEWTTNPH